MKKVSVYSLLLSLLLMTACMGTSDWTYKLPNNYEIWRINSDDIVLYYVEEENKKEVIPSFIKEFAHDERYVLTRNVSSVECNDVFEEVYYILDTKEGKLYGPIQSFQEFVEKVENLGISVEKWHRSYPFSE